MIKKLKVKKCFFKKTSRAKNTLGEEFLRRELFWCSAKNFFAKSFDLFREFFHSRRRALRREPVSPKNFTLYEGSVFGSACFQNNMVLHENMSTQIHQNITS
jgi:hypothetical protein